MSVSLLPRTWGEYLIRAKVEDRITNAVTECFKRNRQPVGIEVGVLDWVDLYPGIVPQDNMAKFYGFPVVVNWHRRRIVTCLVNLTKSLDTSSAPSYK